MPENDSLQPEARLSRLAVAQDLCILGALAGILMLAVSGAIGSKVIQAAVEGIAFALLFGGAAAAPALGIAAMIVISRSNGRLSGLRGATATTIAISAVLALFLGVGSAVSTLAFRIYLDVTRQYEPGVPEGSANATS